VQDGVVVITLNRPEARNALSLDLTAALRTKIKQRGEDPDVGAADRRRRHGFCSGGDVKAMGGRGLRGQMRFEERLSDLHARVTASEPPMWVDFDGHRIRLINQHAAASSPQWARDSLSINTVFRTSRPCVLADLMSRHVDAKTQEAADCPVLGARVGVLPRTDRRRFHPEHSAPVQDAH
jgi:hypothetical protein